MNPQYLLGAAALVVVPLWICNYLVNAFDVREATRQTLGGLLTVVSILFFMAAFAAWALALMWLIGTGLGIGVQP